MASQNCPAPISGGIKKVSGFTENAANAGCDLCLFFGLLLICVWLQILASFCKVMNYTIFICLFLYTSPTYVVSHFCVVWFY